MNEIDVIPNEILTFEIGEGGIAQTVSGKDGNDGKYTYIKRGTNVIASAAGGYGGEYSSSETTPSQGGSNRTHNVGINWTGIDFNSKASFGAGKNGNLATIPFNTSYGGSGGASQDVLGNILAGGNGGNTSKDGLSPLSVNYGAGGGGGTGSQSIGDNTYGIGGAGTSGYIYIEWGGSNGGGGTIGEIVKKSVNNLDPDPKNRIMKIVVGKGGGIVVEDNPDNKEGEGADGNGGISSINIISGGKTVKYEAKGGIRGNDGTMDTGIHGNEMKIPSNFSDIYKEYVQKNMNIAAGQKGEDNYGGMGGYLACILNTKDEEGNTVCAQSVKSNDGMNVTAGPVRPGCGGSSVLSPMYDAICNITNVGTPASGNNGVFGGGGGGGAVLNNIGGKGGNGGNGFVILEYKSVQ